VSLAPSSSPLSGISIPSITAKQTGTVLSLKQYAQQVEASEDFWRRKEARIRDKKDALIAPWPLFNTQKILDADWERQIQTRGYVRMTDAKSRKLGASTFFALKIYYYAMKHGAHVHCIAHNEDSTKTIFAMWQLLYAQSTPELRPVCITSRRDELEYAWADGRRVRFTMGTAGTPDAIRSATCQVLWLSECAFFPDAATLAPAALNTVADGVGVIIAETTSMGGSGWWYEFIEKCMKPEDDPESNDYSVLFTSWLMDTGCVRQPKARQTQAWADWKMGLATGDERLRAGAAQALGLTPEDEASVLACGMTLPQFVWYQNKLVDGSCLRPGEDPRVVRRMEHPVNIEESFLSSGCLVFPPEQMARVEKEAEAFQSKIRFFNMECIDRENAEWPQGWKWGEDAYGCLEVLHEPAEHGEYVIGIDTEEGLSEDKTSINVFDALEFEQCARWRLGSADPVIVAEVGAGMGWWYNEAFIVVETPTGIATLSWLNHALSYPNLYRRERFDVRSAEEPKDALGFKSGKGEKKLMIGELQRRLREGKLHLRFKETIRQFKRYTRFENGKLKAPLGDHDDEVSGVGMVAIGCRPEQFHGIKTHTKKPDIKVVSSISGEYAEDWLRKRTRARQQMISKFGL